MPLALDLKALQTSFPGQHTLDLGIGGGLGQPLPNMQLTSYGPMYALQSDACTAAYAEFGAGPLVKADAP